jgi:phage shock protein PspC (stress-responsive transcriptional regulator)
MDKKVFRICVLLLLVLPALSSYLILFLLTESKWTQTQMLWGFPWIRILLVIFNMGYIVVGAYILMPDKKSDRAS